MLPGCSRPECVVRIGEWHRPSADLLFPQLVGVPADVLRELDVTTTHAGWLCACVNVETVIAGVEITAPRKGSLYRPSNLHLLDAIGLLRHRE